MLIHITKHDNCGFIILIEILKICNLYLAKGFQQYIKSELKHHKLDRIIYEDEKREILEAKKKEKKKE